MSNKQFERLVTNLQSIMRCPHCSGQYQLEDMHYLGQMDAMTFLHMRCTQCQTPVFASVALTNDQGEIKPADIATDSILFNSHEAAPESNLSEPVAGPEFSRKSLNSEDSPAFEAQAEIPIEDLTVNRLLKATLEPVAYDDVLSTHEYLNTFAGDFESIFGAL